MAFDPRAFSLSLLSQTLFYDVEYGVLGNLSLIDQEARREVYIASFVPEEHRFIIEEATEWETEEEDDDLGYALAIDSEEYGSYKTHEETAGVLLTLAAEKGLWPSLTLGIDEED